MNRPLTQTILSLILCPLLPAQQISQTATQQPPNPPVVHASLDFVKGTKIQLVAQDSISIEAAQRGAPLHFVVDKDVAIDGTTVIQAGVPVSAVISKVNRGSYEKSRDGYIDLRFTQRGSQRPVVVRLGGIIPEPIYRYDGGYGPNKPTVGQIVWPLVIIGIVALALLGGDN